MAGSDAKRIARCKAKHKQARYRKYSEWALRQAQLGHVARMCVECRRFMFPSERCSAFREES